MRRLLTLPLALLLVLLHMPAAAEDPFADLGRADSLELGDPVERFERDASRERYRFYAVVGSTLEIPAVGGLSYRRCFGDVAELTRIDGTRYRLEVGADAEAPERDAAGAGPFARVYNERMRSLLLERGLATCPADADWASALAAMGELVRGSYPAGSGSAVAAAWNPERAGYEVGVRIPDLGGAEPIAERLCMLLAENGLGEALRLRFTRARVHPAHSPRRELICRSGLPETVP